MIWVSKGIDVELIKAAQAIQYLRTSVYLRTPAVITSFPSQLLEPMAWDSGNLYARATEGPDRFLLQKAVFQSVQHIYCP